MEMIYVTRIAQKGILGNTNFLFLEISETLHYHKRRFPYKENLLIRKFQNFKISKKLNFGIFGTFDPNGTP
jgi:hypothetical protein